MQPHEVLKAKVLSNKPKWLCLKFVLHNNISSSETLLREQSNKAQTYINKFVAKGGVTKCE